MRADGGEPRLLRGAVRAWPAVGRWSAEWLAGAHPDWEVPVGATARGQLALDRRLTLRMQRQPLPEALAAGYVMAPLDELPPALRAAVAEPALVRGARWRSGKLWISARDTVTPLHFDVAHNFHALVSGRKRFRLYRRADWCALYPQPPWSGLPNFSRVDPERVDGAFPRFARARPLLFTLEPGDALVIPGGVWHHVTSELDSVSVNFWWARGLHARLAAGTDALKRWRGLVR